MMEGQHLRQGPIDDTVLVLQQGHRSRAVWQANGRGPRESATVTIRRCEREFRALPPPSAPIVELVRQAGFFGLLNMQYMQLDLALLTALVERWRPETHTFHLTSGEATVTLQDVEIITGLPVDGRPVTGSTNLNWEEMVRDLLGLELEEAGRRRGNKVTLQWLRGHFNGQVQETDTQVQIEQKARGYIMQLIGGMVVPDESSGRVHLCYLELLRDLRVVGQYSWGSAGLGTLYRALCHLSESNSKDAGGFFILLQVWAWERLPYLAPGRVGDRPPRQGAALMGRWDDKFHSPDLATHVVGHYRHSLDMQKPDEVIWQPYKDGLIELLPPFCSAGRNIWRAMVPLINFNIIEMHQPERVMRQFGYRQLPPEPSSARDRSHGMEMKKHSHNWAEEHRVHVQRWQNRLQFVVQEGQPDIVGAYPDEDEYVTWYKRITVPFVSQMSASLDKLTNLLRSLISTDLSERVQAVGRQGLMCIVTQEKFLRKEPPVHGVWIPPGVVEEEEVIEDQGNGGVHADEEVAVDANVEAAEGEQHDGHGHGDDLVAQPRPQQEDHPMPMLHISPGIALSPFFTTPTDLHDGIGSSSQPGSLSESQTTPEDWTNFIVEPIGSGGESSFVDAPVAKRMRLDSAQGDRMQVDAQAEEQILRGESSTLRTHGDGEVTQDHERVQESVQLVQGQAMLQVEGHDELPPNVPVEGHDELHVEVPVEENDQLAAEVQVEVPELRRGTRTRRRPQCGTDSHKGLHKGKHRH